MKIATFNVNSINARLPRILDWFDHAKPDVAVLQEIKCIDEKFPIGEFEDRGYNCAVHGQKTYNGVAIISKHPIEDVIMGLPDGYGKITGPKGETDDQSRYIEALICPIADEDGTSEKPVEKPVRICGIYLPNGNPVFEKGAPDEFSLKYKYKLAWMEKLNARAKILLTQEEDFLITGDFNVIPEAHDCYDASKWVGDALYRPETHALFRPLLNMGLTDALRVLKGDQMFFSYWDYMRGAWQKDNGIRIDHFLCSSGVADRLVGGDVDKFARDPMTGNQDVKPSDHTPVWIEID